jgi:hypothetical protein
MPWAPRNEQQFPIGSLATCRYREVIKRHGIPRLGQEPFHWLFTSQDGVVVLVCGNKVPESVENCAVGAGDRPVQLFIIERLAVFDQAKRDPRLVSKQEKRAVHSCRAAHVGLPGQFCVETGVEQPGWDCVADTINDQLGTATRGGQHHEE